MDRANEDTQDAWKITKILTKGTHANKIPPLNGNILAIGEKDKAGVFADSMEAQF